jgi:hypothetical protein
LINDQDKKNPYIAIIDLDLSVPLEYVDELLVLSTPMGGTFCYYAPEELLNIPINMKKRDEWQLASAIYDTLGGIPPYGYRYNGKTFVELSDQNYTDQLVRV